MRKVYLEVRRIMVSLCCLIGTFNNLNAQKGAEMTISEFSGNFAIVSQNGESSNIVISNNEKEVVGVAANMFANDAEDITGIKPVVSNNIDENRNNIIVGTIGTSDIIDQMAKDGVIDIDDVKGKWETFGIKTAEYNNKNVLVVYGSDPRGTAYGLMEISREMGVNPWTWWADIIPEKKTGIYISTAGTVYGPPSVKYRGIFINDEDWGLQPWGAKHWDTDIKDLGPKSYEKVFELMLRMKSNYLWPAMHPCTKAFWYYKDNPKVAKKYDIVLGSAHCEPLLRNNVDEWVNNYQEEYGTPPGQWSWKTNRENVIRYWTDRVIESKEQDAIYTVGMRGIHDSQMEGYNTDEERRQALKEVINTQREILSSNLGKNAEDIPQVFNPYKEALTLYRLGLDLADDITLLWPDDNFGYIRQLSDPEEQKRSGGGGVYYHFSYWGVPNDHLWVSSVSPALTSYEMCKAYDQNCKTIWIYNVGDIKPAELETQFGMDLAWDVDKWRPENAHEYPYYWALEIFGDEEIARRIAHIKKEYYRLAASGKPEHIYAITYTEDEILQRVNDYRKLTQEVKAVETMIPDRLKDAYFQLIGYPCEAVANMNEKTLLARQSFTSASRGEEELAIRQGQEAIAAFQNIVTLTNKYNKDIADGKWDGIMDYAPRGLKHFYTPSVATADDINRDEIIAPEKPLLHRVKLAEFNSGNDAGNMKVIYGLGIADTSVTVLPLNMKTYNEDNITSAPYVEYKIPVNKGSNKITVKCLPTFPVYEGLDLRYAISMDGEKPVFHSIKMEAERNPWYTNVQTGFSFGEHIYMSDEEKNINLRIYMADPGLVLSDIVVNLPKNSPYTSMLVNPGFEYKAEGVLNNGEVTRGDVYGWKRTGTIIGESLGLSSDATGYEGTSICWYNSVPMPDFFELSQTVEGLPAGEYIVRCKMAVFTDRNTNERLFANNVSQYYGPEKAYDKNIVKTEKYSFAGHEFGPTLGAAAALKEMAVKVFVTEGENLTVGIRSSNMKADGTKATDNSGWFKVDDFRIELVREINSDSLIKDLDNLLTEARELRDTTVAGVRNGEYPEENRKQFVAAIEDAEKIRNAQPQADDKTLVKTIGELENEIRIYRNSEYNFNNYIVNRSFEYSAEGVKNDGSTVRGLPYGWLQTGYIVGNSFGINNDAVNIVGQNCCWYNSAPMPNPFELYQVINGLPAGRYKVSCRMTTYEGLLTTQRLFANNNVTYFGSRSDYDRNLTPGEINSFAGLKPLSIIGYLQNMSVEVVIKEGEALKLGVRSSNVLKDGTRATNNAGWFKVDDFNLEYIGPENLQLDENNENETIVEKETVCDVLLKRTFKADNIWNTVCLPFDIDSEQCEKYFSDIRVLKGLSEDNNVSILEFSDKINSIKAGMPYIVKANDNYEELLFNDVTVRTSKPETNAITVEYNNKTATMTGNYGLMENIKNMFFLNNNKFFLADEQSDVNIKGFRATITLNETESYNTNVLYLKIDGTVTAINNISMQNINNGNIYNIDGKLIGNEKETENLKKGIYIINGKKIIK